MNVEHLATKGARYLCRGYMDFCLFVCSLYLTRLKNPIEINDLFFKGDLQRPFKESKSKQKITLDFQLPRGPETHFQVNTNVAQYRFLVFLRHFLPYTCCKYSIMLSYVSVVFTVCCTAS